MKCFYCGGEADMQTAKGFPICHSCAEQKGYTVCTELGKVIENADFQCDKICSDCIWKEDFVNEKMIKKGE